MLVTATEEEKPALYLARAELIKMTVSAKLGGGPSLAPQATKAELKVPIDETVAPGGLQSIVGLIIGTRGMTQKLLEVRFL